MLRISHVQYNVRSVSQDLRSLGPWLSLCLTTGVWLDDEGLYICEAKNQFGTITAEARVGVTGLGRLV